MDKIRNLQKSNWNTTHSNYERKNLKYDDWLNLFENEILKCTTPIIDLGCGSGNNTLWLLERGKDVIPCDYSENAIENIKKNFPEIKRTECFDMVNGFPFPDNFTDIVIADLTLHYFSEKDTMKILGEIKRVLRGGLLAFRVNSINDVNHGAGQGIEIETHLYETEAEGYKRFFDENDIKHFFNGWDISYMQEGNMMRYTKPKKVWRCFARTNCHVR